MIPHGDAVDLVLTEDLHKIQEDFVNEKIDDFKNLSPFSRET